MSQVNSNENQSSQSPAYRFGDFELSPKERMLKSRGELVPLPPKAFDALLYLVSKAGHLVSKAELTNTLWPSTHVSEANLTNLIVSLRKIVGRDAISTVSKHGYRFVASVEGEPGAGASSYGRFVRAKELTVQRGLPSLAQAKDLYWICLTENPAFAPAWAWLGRCCWLLGKFSRGASSDVELAVAALQRALTLDPDLACAHQFLTPIEADTGASRNATVRLLRRLEIHPGEPETLAGLVQVLRFCGLLRESLDVHTRITEVDPTIATSVPHTHFLVGDYASTIESYSGRASYYLDAAAWAALGEQTRAATLLRKRLADGGLSELLRGLMGSLLAVLEGRADGAASQMKSTDATREPEVLVYFARHYAYAGMTDLSIRSLEEAGQAGFVCSPHTLLQHEWLAAIRGHSRFKALLSESENRTGDIRRLWTQAEKNGVG